MRIMHGSVSVPGCQLITPRLHSHHLTRSQSAYHEVLLTESQVSLRIVDLIAFESAGQADSRDRHHPHRCEHLLHRTLIAATNHRNNGNT